MTQSQDPVRNRLIDALSADDHQLLARGLRPVTLAEGDVLFEPGEEVNEVCFPAPGTIAALVLTMRDGSVAEAAMIGQEGAIGGIISAGEKPAFARGVVQCGGAAFRLHTDDLEIAKSRSASLRDHFARYADCLLAQVLQSVACNALHDVEARLARWLLTAQDRIGTAKLHLTHDFMAEMLGVQRTYVTRVLGQLAKTEAVYPERGAVTILDRAKLSRQACECYGALKRHFQRVLPRVYPEMT